MSEDRLSRAFAALADPTRRDIVARLAAGDADAHALGDCAGLGDDAFNDDGCGGAHGCGEHPGDCAEGDAVTFEGRIIGRWFGGDDA